jgi:hypothetical protein
MLFHDQLAPYAGASLQLQVFETSRKVMLNLLQHPRVKLYLIHSSVLPAARPPFWWDAETNSA